MSETNALDVLYAMTEADRAFYQSLRFINNSREQLMVIHQRNTATMLGLVRTHILTEPPPATTTFSFPINLPVPGTTRQSAWGEPVVVSPSREQIRVATTTFESDDDTCAICQEDIE